LAGRGVKVPDQVLVTGFNGFESVRYASPELTTIGSPAYELGRRGGTEILERVETGSFSNHDIILPVKFIAGASA
jgi:LacI family transcriptional regulator